MSYQAWKTFSCKCAVCQGTTSKAYARAHDGKCKTCATGIIPAPKAAPARDAGDWRTEHKRKHGRCEDAPCCGCCGPQGDGDYYGYAAMERD